MRAAGVWSKLFELAIPVATTAVVNVPGIGSASANWTALSARLDGGVKTPLSDIISQVRSFWIADDSQAFDDAAAVFQGDTEATRKFFEQIEKCLDDFGDSVRDYWFELGGIAVLLLSALTAWAALLVLGPLAAYAKGMMEWIGGIAAATIMVLTKALGAFMALAAGTIALGAKGMLQMYNLKPTGDATIDFTQAAIKWKPPTQWVEPTQQQAHSASATSTAPPTKPPTKPSPPPSKPTSPPTTALPTSTAPATKAPTTPPTSIPTTPPTSRPTTPPTTTPPTTTPPTSTPTSSPTTTPTTPPTTTPTPTTTAPSTPTPSLSATP